MNSGPLATPDSGYCACRDRVWKSFPQLITWFWKAQRHLFLRCPDRGLWLSSIIGGWLDNWAIYRRLPQALAEHPLGAILGRVHLERLSKVLSPNVAAWGGSIALGFMLGMTLSWACFLGFLWTSGM